ncbi:hypothetical protein L7F22_045874 [Adiantum nelumboides]|nr:hypothetical protein [Adiantum nelumboides]
MAPLKGGKASKAKKTKAPSLKKATTKPRASSKKGAAPAVKASSVDALPKKAPSLLVAKKPDKSASCPSSYKEDVLAPSVTVDAP